MSKSHDALLIQLKPMPGLAEVDGMKSILRSDYLANSKQVIDEEDDWTGITDPKARKKRQNRLNVRAYRK